MSTMLLQLSADLPPVLNLLCRRDAKFAADVFCADLVTYFGQELNANSSWDKKEGKGWVSGEQDPKRIQELVFQFIKKFVQCKHCSNPETQTELTGKKKSVEIILQCISCGSKSKVDMAERFAKYALRRAWCPV